MGPSPRASPQAALPLQNEVSVPKIVPRVIRMKILRESLEKGLTSEGINTLQHGEVTASLGINLRKKGQKG
jgi:hypothetical protein